MYSNLMCSNLKKYINQQISGFINIYFKYIQHHFETTILLFFYYNYQIDYNINLTKLDLPISRFQMVNLSVDYYVDINYSDLLIYRF